MNRFLQIIACSVLMASCSSQNSPPPAQIATQQPKPAPDKTKPTAVEVAELLKANGILLHEIVDSTHAFDFMKGRPDVGIVSKATTWTKSSNFDITTFRTVDFLRQARARVDALDAKFKATPFECGLILISIQPDLKSSKKLAKDEATKVQEIMKKHYKCK